MNYRTSLNALHTCRRIGTFTNMPIQNHTNLFKNHFPPNIVHAKFNMFTLLCIKYLNIWMYMNLHCFISCNESNTLKLHIIIHYFVMIKRRPMTLIMYLVDVWDLSLWLTWEEVWLFSHHYKTWQVINISNKNSNFKKFYKRHLKTYFQLWKKLHLKKDFAYV